MSLRQRIFEGIERLRAESRAKGGPLRFDVDKNVLHRMIEPAVKHRHETSDLRVRAMYRTTRFSCETQRVTMAILGWARSSWPAAESGLQAVAGPTSFGRTRSLCKRDVRDTRAPEVVKQPASSLLKDNEEVTLV